jgi:CheY-like chemotaxis protein
MAKPLILVVDDEKEVADLISQTIKETGRYDTMAAYSAKEALKTLKNNQILMGIGGNRVRLVMLDIKMPGMDGLEFLEKIRKDFGECIGVCMLTAWEDEEKWDRATSGFVVNYIKKPFKKEDLLNTVDRFFSGEDINMEVETFEKHIDKRAEWGKKKKKPPKK